MKQFENSNINFCKIRTKTKRPFEPSWNTKGYSWDQIQDWLKLGANYGVICGNGLIVIDADNPELSSAVESFFPETFTVETGSGGRHYYYYCPFDKKHVLTKNNIHYGEIQGTGSQVVGPNSIHPNGKIYKIINDINISKITTESVLLFLKPYSHEREQKEKESLHTLNNYSRGSDINSLNITNIIDITKFKGVGNGEFQGANPWHGSTGGTNFMINPLKNVAFCFRCNSGINVAQAIALNEGIIHNCSDRLDASQFKEVLKKAVDSYGLEDTQFKAEEIYWEVKKSEFPDFDIDQFSEYIRRRKTWADAVDMIVTYLIGKNYIYTERDDARPNIWIYENGIYLPNGKTYIKEQCEKLLGKYYQSAIISLVIERIMNHTYIDSDELFSMGELFPDEIAIGNGVLNIRTRELGPFSPKKVFFNKINANYDLQADCINIKKHLKTVLSNDNDYKIVQELFGYLLYKKYSFENAFMLCGGGRNGKSKTIDLMKHFLNPENCVSIPLQQLENDGFAVSELHHKMANLAGDLDPTSLKKTGMFKNLTGQDNVTAQRKFKTRISFKNYAKMIFAANQLPELYDNSFGMEARWVLIDFPYTFVTEKKYKEIPKKERDKYRIQDPFITDKLISNKEMNGLLNFALDGLKRLFEQGKFTENGSSNNLRSVWNRKANSFRAFLEDCTQEDYNSVVSVHDLNTAYNFYCRTLKLTKIKKREITTTLSELNTTQNTMRINDTMTRVYYGIKFLDDFSTNIGEEPNISILNILKLPNIIKKEE